MAPPRWATLLNRYVAVAFVAQILSYAALVALTTHDGATPLVGLLQPLPAPLLVVLSVAAVPAVAMTIGLGQALEFALGVRLSGLDPVLVTQGDVVYFGVALVLAVVVVHYGRRLRRATE